MNGLGFALNGGPVHILVDARTSLSSQHNMHRLVLFLQDGKSSATAMTCYQNRETVHQT